MVNRTGEPNGNAVFAGEPNQAAEMSQYNLPKSGGSRDDGFVNAFGYRLIEMLDAGEREKVVQLLRYFAREGSLSFSQGATPLADLGAGLEKYGYNEIAAIAFSLAYAHSRGDGGWEALGDKRQLPWLGYGFTLSNQSAARTLANEITHLLNEQEYIMGVAHHLIEFCAEFMPEAVLTVWQAAFEVIQHRLPENEKDHQIFNIYKPEFVPDWNLDEALVVLLLARVSHPEFRRKNAALFGVASTISNRPHIAIKPLRWFLSLDTPLSSILIVLSAIVESEMPPFPITTALKSELKELCNSDIFGLRVLSRTLLERINYIYIPPAIDTNLLPITSVLPEHKKQAVLSLDWGARVANISRLWKEFPSLVAQRFDYVWNNSKNLKDISKGRFEAAYSRLYENLPPTPMLFWEKEIFETVFHEMFVGIYSLVKSDDKTTQIKIAEIEKRIIPRVHLHTANYCSRVIRPSLLLPSEQIAGIEPVQTLTESEEYNGWYRCGYFERELIINESRTYIGNTIVSAGIQFQSSLDKILGESPLPYFDADFWWITDEVNANLNQFSGNIAGLDWIPDLLGLCPILVLHPWLTTSLDLRVSTSWQQQLTFTEKTGDIAVLFRSWSVQTIGDQISEENVMYEGCDLIMKPSIFEEMVKQIQLVPRTVKYINRASE